MTQAQKKENMAAIIRVLEGVYPEAPCALEWGGEPWKLLIMGRLSAQCTDARVNLVCRELFSAYPTPQAIAEAPVEELEEYIRPCGLYHVKSQNTKDACKLLLEEYGGVLPDTMEELLRFPGVGRKVANLLLGDIFGKGGVVTDTHCIRICGRLGMYPETQKTPIKVERILVQFGRDTCTARAPRCSECPLASLCAHALTAEKKRTR